MAARKITAVACDIGGVLATVNKSSLSTWFTAFDIDPQKFFSDDFYALQSGKITLNEFLRPWSFANIEELQQLFALMIDNQLAHDVLAHMTHHYFFMSNINEFHYEIFSHSLSLSSFCRQYSILSYQVGYLKPAREFFAHLHRVPIPAAEILYIDDQIENIERAKEFGLMTMHASKPFSMPFDVNQLVIDEY